MGCYCKKNKPVGIDKVKSITSGWCNIIWSNPEVEKIAHERAAVCAVCSENLRNLCLDCGCWIPAKARSLAEICEKWDEIDQKYGL